jgi:DNA-binding transcriptional MerR regulator
MIGPDPQHQPGQTWKAGALAKATGLTVRTLHHYDEIGLLRPSRRLAGGHRLYDAEDVARLYRIIRLRQLGFALSQVADVLAEPEWQLAPAIERHLAEARHRAEMASRLCTRLADKSRRAGHRLAPRWWHNLPVAPISQRGDGRHGDLRRRRRRPLRPHRSRRRDHRLRTHRLGIRDPRIRRERPRGTDLVVPVPAGLAVARNW